jgi:hypothetical protein
MKKEIYFNKSCFVPSKNGNIREDYVVGKV